MIPDAHTVRILLDRKFGRRVYSPAALTFRSLGRLRGGPGRSRLRSAGSGSMGPTMNRYENAPSRHMPPAAAMGIEVRSTGTAQHESGEGGRNHTCDIGSEVLNTANRSDMGLGWRDVGGQRPDAGACGR